MAALPFRARNYCVSAVGTLIFLPVYLFWGGLFSFSFTAIDSIWAWGFGIAACWSQILAILTSFFQPRKAAYWMLINTAIGVLLAIGQVVRTTSCRCGATSPIEPWLHSGSGLIKAGLIFWAPPLFLALLLLRQAPRNAFD